uniref:Putative ovule protein n=1 Tax=Solanum chacoense TaxID=4108 RepID=A0A0V0GHJ1_SOLCH
MHCEVWVPEACGICILRQIELQYVQYYDLTPTTKLALLTRPFMNLFSFIQKCRQSILFFL